MKWSSQSPRVPDPAFRDALATTKQLGSATCTVAGGLTGLSAAGYPCFYNNRVDDTLMRFGGLGQVYGNRITIFAHVIGEESFTDSNGNGQYDENEAFSDLSEAFRDDNEDGVFGGRDKNGAVVAGAAGTSNSSYMVGGDNEEFIDLNTNGSFDAANTKYNGVLCKKANNDAGICSNKLVSISRNITLLQSGSSARISLIESGLNQYAVANYFQSVNVAGGSKTVVAHVSDIHNGRLPVGTVIAFETGNGQIIGPTSCSIVNSSSFGITSCAVTVLGDTDVALQGTSGPLVVTVTTPSGVVSSSSININD